MKRTPVVTREMVMRRKKREELRGDRASTCVENLLKVSLKELWMARPGRGGVRSGVICIERNSPDVMNESPHTSIGGSHIVISAGVDGCIDAEQPKSFTRSNR